MPGKEYTLPADVASPGGDRLPLRSSENSLCHAGIFALAAFATRKSAGLCSLSTVVRPGGALVARWYKNRKGGRSRPGVHPG